MTRAKVLHIIPSLAAVHGGPTTAVIEMMEALNRMGYSNTVALSDDDGRRRRLAADAPERQINGRFYFPKRCDFYTFTPTMSGWLNTHITDFDLVHIHGLFSHVNILAGRACRRHNIPYIVTPHGMANRYGMRHKPFRKMISFRLFERRLLNHAHMVHLTSHDEAGDFDHLNINTVTRIIPLAVRSVGNNKTDAKKGGHKDKTLPYQILYMGRVHPIKNIEAVIAALAQSEMADYHLNICGDGDPKYSAQLKAYAKQLGVAGQITWRGFVSGREKAEIFAKSDIFILPSFSESFGISAIEALSAGLPSVLSSHVANAETLANAGLAKVTDTSATAIANGLCEVSKWKNKAFSTKAKAYFSNHYDKSIISHSLAMLYDEVIEQSHIKTDHNL